MPYLFYNCLYYDKKLWLIVGVHYLSQNIHCNCFDEKKKSIIPATIIKWLLKRIAISNKQDN